MGSRFLGGEAATLPSSSGAARAASPPASAAAPAAAPPASSDAPAAAPPASSDAPAAAPPASSAVAPDRDTRSTEFRAVQGGDEMQSGTALLTEAYAAIWLLALGLILLGMRKLRRLEARLDGLSGEIAQARAEQAKKE